MKYFLAPDVSIITEKQRDQYDQYLLAPGHIHCHPVKVYAKKKVVLGLIHTRPIGMAQDSSIHCWFSERPNEPSIILTLPFSNFKLSRRGFEIVVDQNLLPRGDYFLNLSNIENCENSYQLIFSSFSP